MSAESLQSHAAWDPGALGVAEAIARQMSASLVHSGVSRLVYDCNRPPEAASAIPERSEKYVIPANKFLSPEMRLERVENVYQPFNSKLAQEIESQRSALNLMVTIHSFNPTYHGKKRGVEVGILHGRDDRFALAMMDRLPDGFPFEVRLNEPYSAADGVVHTLDLHGAANGLPSVMLEIRNDLISDKHRQLSFAGILVPWIKDVLAEFGSGATP